MSHEKHLIYEKSISIGNDVWIGEYAIIGANSVVTKSCNSFEIIGGVPAKFLRLNSDHELFNDKYH